MQVVPLQPVPNQTLQVQLGNQPCVLNIYQLTYGLFMDVMVGTESIVGGIICLNLNRIVRYAYLGFIGDFVFVDATGNSDPTYDGLGTRYQLVYLETADLIDAGLVEA